MRRWRRTEQRGETLVEVLVALAILSLAAVAILAGMQLSVFGSDVGRKQATGGAYVRSLAESIQDHVAIKSSNYSACGAAYLDAAYIAGANLPAGYTPDLSGAKVWSHGAWAGCTSSSDNGIQQFTLTVTSPGDTQHQAVEHLVVVIRKACNDTLNSDGTAGTKC